MGHYSKVGLLASLIISDWWIKIRILSLVSISTLFTLLICISRGNFLYVKVDLKHHINLFSSLKQLV